MQLESRRPARTTQGQGEGAPAPEERIVRIAIVGTGISGLFAAHRLHREHAITVYEADGRVGGHTHTVPARVGDRTFRVDTGFIVFNHDHYPLFTDLLDELSVESQPSDMSFSVRCERTGLEYNGTSVDKLFAQRRNLLRPSFHRMVRDIVRFCRDGRAFLDSGDDRTSLRDLVAKRRYGPELLRHYLVPMCAALWSARPDEVLEFPARFVLGFFDNHAMLDLGRRPVWRVVRGGSSRYIEALIRPFADRIRTATPVQAIRRIPGAGVEIRARGHAPERFDEVVLATHADQALRLLADATEDERRILGAIPFQQNEVVLHTDASLLPRTPRARASWNYLLPDESDGRATVTYWMNLLQGLDAPVDLLVTLNCSDRIDPERVIATFEYDHPVFTHAAVAAQKERPRIDGRSGTHFCGAYWGFGFHEDGVRSALDVCRRIQGAVAR